MIHMRRVKQRDTMSASSTPVTVTAVTSAPPAATTTTTVAVAPSTLNMNISCPFTPSYMHTRAVSMPVPVSLPLFSVSRASSVQSCHAARHPPPLHTTTITTTSLLSTPLHRQMSSNTHTHRTPQSSSNVLTDAGSMMKRIMYALKRIASAMSYRGRDRYRDRGRVGVHHSIGLIQDECIQQQQQQQQPQFIENGIGSFIFYTVTGLASIIGLVVLFFAARAFKLWWDVRKIFKSVERFADGQSQSRHSYRSHAGPADHHDNMGGFSETFRSFSEKMRQHSPPASSSSSSREANASSGMFIRNQGWNRAGNQADNPFNGSGLFGALGGMMQDMGKHMEELEKLRGQVASLAWYVSVCLLCVCECVSCVCLHLPFPIVILTLTISVRALLLVLKTKTTSRIAVMHPTITEVVSEDAQFDPSSCQDVRSETMSASSFASVGGESMETHSGEITIPGTCPSGEVLLRVSYVITDLHMNPPPPPRIDGLVVVMRHSGYRITLSGDDIESFLHENHHDFDDTDGYARQSSTQVGDAEFRVKK
jgi:hypothetical protein